jgi:hypothetical protein
MEIADILKIAGSILILGAAAVAGFGVLILMVQKMRGKNTKHLFDRVSPTPEGQKAKGRGPKHKKPKKRKS